MSGIARAFRGAAGIVPVAVLTAAGVATIYRLTHPHALFGMVLIAFPLWTLAVALASQFVLGRRPVTVLGILAGYLACIPILFNETFLVWLPLHVTIAWGVSRIAGRRGQSRKNSRRD